jgi:hypothetical protein
MKKELTDMELSWLFVTGETEHRELLLTWVELPFGD